ncbi:hypothetical protein GQ44DRAFT_733068 [Phaeosphaeriaceae sp. PMI808]|nr:hypothetical protein GQ44DRAFT_733068 [Phaeosphaeriaceae sp. PMI808]
MGRTTRRNGGKLTDPVDNPDKALRPTTEKRRISTLKVFFDSPNESTIQQVFHCIDAEPDLSDYVKQCLRINFGLLLRIPVARDTEGYIERQYQVYDEADVARGFYLQDCISLPACARYYLSRCFNMDFDRFYAEVASRYIENTKRERKMKFLDQESGYQLSDQPGDLDSSEQLIMKLILEGKDVRHLSEQDLEDVNSAFRKEVGCIREENDRPLSYNVRLLLESVWTLAFNLFCSNPAPERPSPEELESRKMDLLTSAIQNNFMVRLYAKEDTLYLGETALRVFHFCTAVPGVAMHIKLLKDIPGQANEKKRKAPLTDSRQQKRARTDAGTKKRPKARPKARRTAGVGSRMREELSGASDTNGPSAEQGTMPPQKNLTTTSIVGILVKGDLSLVCNSISHLIWDIFRHVYYHRVPSLDPDPGAILDKLQTLAGQFLKKYPVESRSLEAEWPWPATEPDNCIARLLAKLGLALRNIMMIQIATQDKDIRDPQGLEKILEDLQDIVVRFTGYDQV